ncbi:unnamed protein product [Lasius platythorax]|uniref:Uncharacterized protein n=1 Tax=Lasius platythorax TaxID=488582 RepID=A0AAV2MWG6_9HYME
MNKIVLMQPLKLPDDDAIQLLTNGISSLAIRGVAASLKVDSLNEFLREMQHITASCGTSLKRSSPVLPKRPSLRKINHHPKIWIIKRKKMVLYILPW